MRNRAAIVILLVAVYCSLFTGTGYAMPWSWDMFKQAISKPQKEKAPAPPAGAVPVKGKPLALKDRAASIILKNPVSNSQASLERGKTKYNTYCATCHGDAGKGDGIVGQKYVPPTDLTGEYVQNKPDGDIYYTITYGGLAIMPAYSDSVPIEDRWHIVNYIKNGMLKK